MHDCEKLREEIWEAVEVGEMPDSLSVRIGGCEICRRELIRAESATIGFEALRSADAPDCAGAVMARIDRVAHRGRAVWAYALGVALVVGAAATVMSLHRPRVAAPCPGVAKVKVQPSVVQPGPERPEGARAVDKSGPEDGAREAEKIVSDTRERRVRVVGSAPKRCVYQKPKRLPVPDSVRSNENGSGVETAAIGEPLSLQETAAVAASPAGQDKQRILIIITRDITGQSEPSEALVSYGCTQTNPETGAVTKCSFERCGESVEIYMDAKPGCGKAPGEGRLNYEGKVSV